MAHATYLIALSSLLVVANCATPTVITETKYVEKEIAVVNRPRPVNLSDPRFYVVSKENFDEFIAEYRATNGTETFIAFSVRDYEAMALNIAELKRYIEQQDKIIVYYENSVK